MSGPEVSHGRGGAGNINPDDTQYVDGEIVRQGEVGSHGDGAYSTGRGGGGNIAGQGEPTAAARADADAVPAEATMTAKDEDHHVGRGGAANVQLSAEHEAAAAAASKKDAASPGNVGLADKLKGKIFGAFGSKKSSS